MDLITDNLYKACNIYGARCTIVLHLRDTGHIIGGGQDAHSRRILAPIEAMEYDIYNLVNGLLEDRDYNPEQEVSVTIRTLTGRDYHIRLLPTDNVLLLRYLLFRESGIDMVTQELLSGGNTLRSSTIIGDFIGLNGPIVHLVMRLSRINLMD